MQNQVPRHEIQSRFTPTELIALAQEHRILEGNVHKKCDQSNARAAVNRTALKRAQRTLNREARVEAQVSELDSQFWNQDRKAKTAPHMHGLSLSNVTSASARSGACVNTASSASVAGSGITRNAAPRSRGAASATIISGLSANSFFEHRVANPGPLMGGYHNNEPHVSFEEAIARSDPKGNPFPRRRGLSWVALQGWSRGQYLPLQNGF